MGTELILASTSPARRALLDSLGLPYRAVAPGVDERVSPGTVPEKAVELLAERKARAVQAQFPSAWIIGSDQLAVSGQTVLGKPADREAARAQLQLLGRQEHRLVTGLCLLGPTFHRTLVDVARLRFYPLTPEELERYLDLEEWRGCAGGYRIEGAGQGLICHLEGDRSSVQGLPLFPLVAMLRQVGVPFFPARSRSET